jgi:hypothetical protein
MHELDSHKLVIGLKKDTGEIVMAEITAKGSYLWKWDYEFPVSFGTWVKSGYFINNRWAWMPINDGGGVTVPDGTKITINGSISPDMYKTLSVVIIEEDIYEEAAFETVG